MEEPHVKPIDLDSYLSWAAHVLGCDFKDPKVVRIYETNVNNILTSVTQHPFFVGFSAEVAQWQEEYHHETNSALFMDSAEPHLCVKSFRSVVDKSFRMNILWNKAFPKAPKRGWVNLQNIYAMLNDLVRGSLVCRFIDGPERVARYISDYADRLDLVSRSYSQEREDGYYAFHVYVTFRVSVFDADWNEADVSVEVEIQITTQLQEVLRSLTHHLYESQRLQVADTSGKWKWEFTSSRFKIGYLSHALHLLESVIVESRDRLLNFERSKAGNGDNPNG